MKKMHVRRNDQVEVIAGSAKGQSGRVLRVYPAKGTLIIERVNMRKKHQRANPQANQKGGIVEREAPVHVSNVRVVERGAVEGRGSKE